MCQLTLDRKNELSQQVSVNSIIAVLLNPSTPVQTHNRVKIEIVIHSFIDRCHQPMSRSSLVGPFIQPSQPVASSSSSSTASYTHRPMSRGSATHRHFDATHTAATSSSSSSFSPSSSSFAPSTQDPNSTTSHHSSFSLSHTLPPLHSSTSTIDPNVTASTTYALRLPNQYHDESTNLFASQTARTPTASSHNRFFYKVSQSLLERELHHASALEQFCRTRARVPFYVFLILIMLAPIWSEFCFVSWWQKLARRVSFRSMTVRPSMSSAKLFARRYALLRAVHHLIGDRVV